MDPVKMHTIPELDKLQTEKELEEEKGII